jgi:hypothetical protein
VPKAKEEEIESWLCWYFSTNRAHALDFYLVFVTRTYLEQGVEEQPISQFSLRLDAVPHGGASARITHGTL